jgi:hypothetical protein
VLTSEVVLLWELDFGVYEDAVLRFCAFCLKQDAPWWVYIMMYTCADGFHRWFKKAADMGHTPAATLLGLCYEDGVGVETDVEQAIEWFRKASSDAEAAFASEPLEPPDKYIQVLHDASAPPGLVCPALLRPDVGPTLARLYSWTLGADRERCCFPRGATEGTVMRLSRACAPGVVSPVPEFLTRSHVACGAPTLLRRRACTTRRRAAAARCATRRRRCCTPWCSGCTSRSGRRRRPPG